ncbi:MAG: hypothetical protein EZS28_005390 [Streblomastix strix]|uniref:Uncharacterized protein n=1 Tax=Streblomastix strix TaxID=222440 RepID=A0A5J4WW70_9EUKA|nr:MAG: hypothetical protein EZS28_005390 [Streblomastix strix]
MFPWKFKQKARQIQQTQKEESLQVNINEKEKDNNQIINNKEKEQKEIIDSSQQIEEQNLRDSCDEALLDEFDQNESNDGSEEENNLNLEKEKKEHNDKGAQKIENIENKIMLVNQLFEDEVISILLRTAMDRMIKPFLVGNRWEWISMYKPSSSRRKPLNYPQVSVSSILQYTNENTTKVCLHHLFARALGDGSLIPKGCQVSHLYPNIRILAVIVESREKNELRKQCHKNKLGEGSLVTAMQCQHLDTTLCRTIPDNFIFPKPNAEETEKQN